MASGEPHRLSVAVDPRGVAQVTLDRADKRNAMDAAMIAALRQGFAALGADPAVRVVVLTGAGDTFCAGGDLAWMREQVEGTADMRATAARALAEMLGVVDACPRPVIGRVQGNAFGGGVGLAAVCDVCVAVEGARFGLTETRLGLIPATIGPYVLARMGAGMARRVFMSARLFDAAEAVTLGLVARAVPADRLDAAVEAEIAPYLSCAPGAVAEAKALARSLGGAPESRAVAESIAALERRWDSGEAAEGIAAFLDKRAPSWAADSRGAADAARASASGGTGHERGG